MVSACGATEVPDAAEDAQVAKLQAALRGAAERRASARAVAAANDGSHHHEAHPVHLTISSAVQGSFRDVGESLRTELAEVA